MNKITINQRNDEQNSFSLSKLTHKWKIEDFFSGIEQSKIDIQKIYDIYKNGDRDKEVIKILEEQVKLFNKLIKLTFAGGNILWEKVSMELSNTNNFAETTLILSHHFDLIEWFDRINENITTFERTIFLLNILKSHVLINKKNLNLFKEFYYNQNLEKFFYHIKAKNIAKYINEFDPTTTLLNEDISSSLYDMKLLYNYDLENDKQIQVIEMNGFFYFYFDEISKEVIDFFTQKYNTEIIDDIVSNYKIEIDAILYSRGYWREIWLREKDILLYNQNAGNVILNLRNDSIINETLDKNIDKIQKKQLFYLKQYFNFWEDTLDKIKQYNWTEELLKYLEDLNDYSDKFYMNFYKNIEFKDKYILMEMILDTFDFKDDFKKTIDLMIIFFRKDLQKNYEKNDVQKILTILKNEYNEQYKQIEELYLKEIEWKNEYDITIDEYSKYFLWLYEKKTIKSWNFLLSPLQKVLNNKIKQENFNFSDLSFEELLELWKYYDTRYYLSQIIKLHIQIMTLSSSSLKKDISKNIKIDFNKIDLFDFEKIFNFLKNIDLYELTKIQNLIFTNQNNIEFEYDEIKNIYININDIWDIENIDIKDNNKQIDTLKTDLLKEFLYLIRITNETTQ